MEALWRAFRWGCALLAVATIANATAARPAPDAPVAETAYGRVQGSVEDGINVFKGIRYGADTEARRFRPALDPVRWTDTADATAYGNQCPQIDGGENHLFESWKNIQPSSEIVCSSTSGRPV